MDAKLADNHWSLRPALVDGVALCEIIKKISPESIPYINTDTEDRRKLKENLIFFLSAVEELGVPRNKTFQNGDLYENANFLKVIECLESLSVVATEMGIPGIEPAPFFVRWSEEQVNATMKELQRVHYKHKATAEIKRVEPVSTVGHVVNWTERYHYFMHIPHHFYRVHEALQVNPNIERSIIKLQARIRGRIARRLYQRR